MRRLLNLIVRHADAPGLVRMLAREGIALCADGAAVNDRAIEELTAMMDCACLLCGSLNQRVRDRHRICDGCGAILPPVFEVPR